MTLRCENCGSDDIAQCERDDSAEYEYICNVCDMIQRPQIQPIDVYAELTQRIEKLEKRLEYAEEAIREWSEEAIRELFKGG